LRGLGGSWAVVAWAGAKGAAKQGRFVVCRRNHANTCQLNGYAMALWLLAPAQSGDLLFLARDADCSGSAREPPRGSWQSGRQAQSCQSQTRHPAGTGSKGICPTAAGKGMTCFVQACKDAICV